MTFPTQSKCRKKRGARRLIVIADQYADMLGTVLSRSRQEQSGLVYLMFDPVSNVYKLGRTRRPHARFIRLQTLMPHDLEITHYIETTDILAVERHFHQRFAARRLRGEWFRLTDADVASFVRHDALYAVREVGDE